MSLGRLGKMELGVVLDLAKRQEVKGIVRGMLRAEQERKQPSSAESG